MRTICCEFNWLVTLMFKSSGNQINLNGEPINNDVVATTSHPSLEISTPFFPLLYPRDYEVEYNIRCPGECQVHVNFIDFHVAPATVLEVRRWTQYRFHPRIYIGCSTFWLSYTLTFNPPVFILDEIHFSNTFYSKVSEIETS